MVPIKTAPALQQAITSTYIFDIVIAVVFVFLMILVVNLVKYQDGKKDNSGKVRRAWFFSILAIVLVASIGFDYFVYLRSIKVPAFIGKYMMNMGIASIISGILYFVTGFVVIKLAPIGSKLESIFPRKDK
ncbi:MAG: hypothetical protein ACI3ZQ_03815 [Candidatus Cryptobacteroides sp.]